MTPNQRQDLDKELELEERWRPLNYRDERAPWFHWFVGIAAAVCVATEIVWQLYLKLK